MWWGVVGLVLIFVGALAFGASDYAWGVMGLAALYLIGTWVVLHTPWLLDEVIR